MRDVKVGTVKKSNAVITSRWLQKGHPAFGLLAVGALLQNVVDTRHSAAQ